MGRFQFINFEDFRDDYSDDPEEDDPEEDDPEDLDDILDPEDYEGTYGDCRPEENDPIEENE
jgi:hypothetical protein